MSATLLALALLALPAADEEEDEKPIPAAPARAEGEGPFARLILRGVTLIDGTGAPAVGPVDVVIEQDRIREVKAVGAPGVAIDPKKRPKAKAGDKELDLTGKFLLPGLVDLHGHIGGSEQGTPAEYVFKLWMAHGITTIRDPACGNGLEWVLDHKKKSAANEITAPRIEAYLTFGKGRKPPITTAGEAREWVRATAAKGADGIKFFGAQPEVFRAALEQALESGLLTACHHTQLHVARANVLDTARWGLTTMEHWYGLPEALFTDRTVQDFPPGYNYANEQDRFAQAGRLWRQAAPPGSERWVAVRDELIKLGFTMVPTLNIYEATRDLMRAYRAEWHEQHTLPSLWDFFRPGRKRHGSFWFAWSTEDEVEWRDNYRLWMTFLDDFKDHGGRVAVGSDSGYIYQLYGFGTIRELELLREAGFHPLEVVRAATLMGAEALARADRIGSVEAGKLADLVVVGENPLRNLKVLYGTGALALDAEERAVRVGGVELTIKGGVIYDARKLLADVRRMVREAREKSGKALDLPGVAPEAGTPAKPPESGGAAGKR